MLIPAFQLHLNVPILEGLVVVGHYDGKHPCLTCATSAGKIFIHSPHERNEDANNQLRYLNINRRITALAAGRMNPEVDNSSHSLSLSLFPSRREGKKGDGRGK
jgi:Bardet-Biedl syndrome 2 protein